MKGLEAHILLKCSRSKQTRMLFQPRWITSGLLGKVILYMFKDTLSGEFMSCRGGLKAYMMQVL